MTTIPEHAELKPCPFCGGEPEIERMGTPRVSMIITCTDCGASVESGEEWISEHCKWNTRTPPAAPVAEDAVEALQRIADGCDDAQDVATAYLRKNKMLPEQGYTLSRETMTEAELEREAENLSVISRTNGVTLIMIKNMFVELAKKYRG